MDDKDDVFNNSVENISYISNIPGTKVMKPNA